MEEYVKAIHKITKDPVLRKQMSVNNLEASQHYSVGAISKKIADVYIAVFSGEGYKS